MKGLEGGRGGLRVVLTGSTKVLGRWGMGGREEGLGETGREGEGGRGGGLDGLDGFDGLEGRWRRL